MSDAKTSDLKTGTFDTWATLEKRKAANAVVTVKVDDKAAVRQKIIAEIRRAKVEFITRSDWNRIAPCRQQLLVQCRRRQRDAPRAGRALQAW